MSNNYFAEQAQQLIDAIEASRARTRALAFKPEAAAPQRLSKKSDDLQMDARRVAAGKSKVLHNTPVVRLSAIARHWSKQTEQAKGIRLEADALDLLNAIGVGELILAAAAELQRDLCLERNSQNQSMNAEVSSSSDAQTEPTWKSSGTTSPSDAIEALVRVQRRLKSARAN